MFVTFLTFLMTSFCKKFRYRDGIHNIGTKRSTTVPYDLIYCGCMVRFADRAKALDVRPMPALFQLTGTGSAVQVEIGHNNVVVILLLAWLYFFQGCGSAFILCGSGSSSFSECGSGSGSRSSLTKFEEEKNHKSFPKL